MFTLCCIYVSLVYITLLSIIFFYPKLFIITLKLNKTIVNKVQRFNNQSGRSVEGEGDAFVMISEFALF